MTNLENEIKEAFDKEEIDINPEDILRKSNVPFLGKKQLSFKESVALSAVSFSLAGIVLCVTLISPLSYQESVEDSIRNVNFTSHIIGALGLSNSIMSYDNEIKNYEDEEIQNEVLPPIAYLNYAYTRKDKRDFSFDQKETEISDTVYKVQETIEDTFLNKTYNLFYKKKNSSEEVKGCVFIDEDEIIKEESKPQFDLQITPQEKDRDCYLNINFTPTLQNYSDYSFNLKEKNDGSFAFTFYYQDEVNFICNYYKDIDYNIYEINIATLTNPIVFKIKSLGGMSYQCSYTFNDYTKTEILDFNFNSDGTIETI